MQKIIVVAPCYNESENLLEFYDQLKSVFSKHLDLDFKIVFVDNKSTDDSLEIYSDLIEKDGSVEAILMSRNFGGPQPSILAGIKYAVSCGADAVVILDADLQDPPPLISKFIEKWRQGFKVVYGFRPKRDETFVRRIGYYFFYRLFRYLSFLDIPLDAGDFCLLDAVAAKHIADFSEKDVLIRGLRSWIGFRQIGVEYDRPIRKKGVTNFSFWGYVRVAKDAIVNFSDKPLEYVSYLAIGSAVATCFVGLFYLYFALTTEAPKGFFTLLMIMLVFGTLQLTCLGVLAEYLMRIFREVKSRPPFIIETILKKSEKK